MSSHDHSDKAQQNCPESTVVLEQATEARACCDEGDSNPDGEAQSLEKENENSPAQPLSAVLDTQHTDPDSRISFDSATALLQERIDYGFRDRSLLHEALTHRSFSNERGSQLLHNQRLEFLGDACLGLIVAHMLFEDHPEDAEGVLSKLKSSMVSEGALAICARGLGIGACLRLGRGEARSGGADKNSLLADALEALIGAIYLDGGFEAAQRFVLRELPEQLAAQSFDLGADSKTQLQELLQRKLHARPEYRLELSSGPQHARLFTIEVLHGAARLGQGRGRSKKDAEQAAARAALQFFRSAEGKRWMRSQCELLSAPPREVDSTLGEH
ncbi:MAG: ribonuclease III [Myxococcota bacterium]|jgi:ribonuclease-3|nr:ribonuclease III [Myxococcota bacterium]